MMKDRYLIYDDTFVERIPHTFIIRTLGNLATIPQLRLKNSSRRLIGSPFMKRLLDSCFFMPSGATYMQLSSLPPI